MNALQHETSPYLLQHANNPVDWFGWSGETLARAKKENKPILVSIGYATCHWCHVMAHESFEDAATAKFMNENFINIKIDREERPDLDMIYMAACQIFTGGGGWPLNVFLTPDAKPYFAGTYFPPTSKYKKPTWREVLITMSDAFKNKKEQVYEQAEKITELIALRNNTFGGEKLESKTVKSFLNFEKEGNPLDAIIKTIKQTFDTQFGGFGGAPKFPHAMLLNFLNEYSYYNKSKLGVEAKNHVQKTLSCMIQGGIYDQLGGGFARYSVDAQWTVPHFEKMLYDNALLLTVMAHSLDSKNPKIELSLIETIMKCILKEFSTLDVETFQPFGFYSAIDADSEGEEGTFYTWHYDEFCRVVGKQFDILTKAFGVTKTGNLDGKNVLTAYLPDDNFLKDKRIITEKYSDLVLKAQQKLFAHRALRERPITDTKMILSWNAMMISALCEAFKGTKEESYKMFALKSLEFLKEKFYVATDKNLCHTFSNGKQRYNAFLDDYAEYIAALIEAYYLDFNTEFLKQAHQWLKYSVENFWDEASCAFFYSEASQTDLISRQKDFYDNATPSGNSTMAQNLLKLSIITGDLNYRDMAHKMIAQILPEAESYPNGFGRWLSAYQSCVQGITEVAVIGKGANALAQKIYFAQIPNCIIMSSETVDKNYPLLNQNALEFANSEKCCIFVCSDYVCQKPVHTVREVLALIQNK